MFDIVLDTLMLPIEREVAADIRKRLSSLSWRPNQIAVIRTSTDPYVGSYQWRSSPMRSSSS